MSGYLWAASLGYGYPELFSIAGESKRDILHSPVMQKLPDLLILFLLFIPLPAVGSSGCNNVYNRHPG